MVDEKRYREFVGIKAKIQVLLKDQHGVTKEAIKSLSKDLAALKPGIPVDKLRSEALEEDLDKKIKQLENLRIQQSKYMMKEEVDQFYQPPKSTQAKNKVNLDFQTQTPQNMSFSKFASEVLDQRSQSAENGNAAARINGKAKQDVNTFRE